MKYFFIHWAATSGVRVCEAVSAGPRTRWVRSGHLFSKPEEAIPFDQPTKAAVLVLTMIERKLKALERQQVRLKTLHESIRKHGIRVALAKGEDRTAVPWGGTDGDPNAEAHNRMVGVPECTGYYDDGVMPTNCTMKDGCGRLNCPSTRQ